MSDELKHIDNLFQEKLGGYEAISKKSPKWGILGLKLMILNLGGWSLFAATTIFVAVSGTVIYTIIEPEPFGIQINNIESKTEIKIEANPKKENTTILPIDTVEADELNSENEIIINQRNKNQNIDTFTETEEEIITPAEPSSKKSAFRKSRLKSEISISKNQTATSKYSLKSLEKGNDKFFSMYSLDHDIFNVENKTNISTIRRQTVFTDSLSVMGIKNRRLSLEVFLNPSFSLGSGTASRTIEEIENKALFSIGFGAEIKCHLNNWYILTGLNFSQFGGKSVYQLQREIEDPNHLVQSIDTTFRWYYDPPYLGEPWIVSIDTSWIPGSKTEYFQQSTTRKITYLEIPLLAGYKWEIDKLSFDISTGVSFGIPIENSGGIPSPANNELIAIENISITKPLINYIFQAGIIFPYKERINLIVKPNLKYNLNNTYKDEDYAVKQKYINLGIKVGISISL